MAYQLKRFKLLISRRCGRTDILYHMKTFVYQQDYSFSRDTVIVLVALKSEIQR